MWQVPESLNYTLTTRLVRRYSFQWKHYKYYKFKKALRIKVAFCTLNYRKDYMNWKQVDWKRQLLIWVLKNCRIHKVIIRIVNFSTFLPRPYSFSSSTYPGYLYDWSKYLYDCSFWSFFLLLIFIFYIYCRVNSHRGFKPVTFSHRIS